MGFIDTMGYIEPLGIHGIRLTITRRASSASFGRLRGLASSRAASSASFGRLWGRPFGTLGRGGLACCPAPPGASPVGLGRQGRPGRSSRATPPAACVVGPCSARRRPYRPQGVLSAVCPAAWGGSLRGGGA